MATVTSQTIIDGERNLVVKLHITGATDLSDETLIDASSFSPTFTSASLMRVQGSMPVTEQAGGAGPIVSLEWDATSNVPIIDLSAGNFDHDFSEFGGIPNNAGAGKTGDIVASSAGASADTGYFLILHLRKG